MARHRNRLQAVSGAHFRGLRRVSPALRHAPAAEGCERPDGRRRMVLRLRAERPMVSGRGRSLFCAEQHTPHVLKLQGGVMGGSDRCEDGTGSHSLFSFLGAFWVYPLGFSGLALHNLAGPYQTQTTNRSDLIGNQPGKMRLDFFV